MVVYIMTLGIICSLESIVYNINDERQNDIADHVTLKSASDNDPMFTSKVKQYFSDMMTHEDPFVSQFAKDFIVYQFYSTGDNQSTNTVKISEEDRKDIGFHTFIKEEMDRVIASGNEVYFDDNDIRDIFENRWYDNLMVPRADVIGELEYNFAMGMMVRVDKPAISSLDGETINGSKYPVIWVDTEARPVGRNISTSVFLPYVKVAIRHDNGSSTDVLYRLIGTSMVGTKPRPVYSAVNKFGSRNSGISMIEHGFRCIRC